MSNIEQAIINTVVYFDIFDYPLTLLEIWQWLYGDNLDNGCLLGDIQKTLQNSEELKRVLETRQGFYFLAGRQHIIRTRLTRYNIAEEKFWRAKIAAKLLSWLPFIKMVAVCNTLGYSNTRIEGDIDFFIITTSKRIWLARFFSAGLIQFLGWRSEPDKASNKDKICLTFFVTEDNLDLQPVALMPSDIYLDFWRIQLVPLYDENNYYQRLLAANQEVFNRLPLALPYLVNRRRLVKGSLLGFKRFVEKIHSRAFNGWSEKFYRWLQIKLLPAKLKQMMNKDSRVVVNSQMLKFHDNDRRALYQELWERQLAQLKH